MIETNKVLIEKYLKELDTWKKQTKPTIAEIVKEDTVEEKKDDNTDVRKF
jgi:hypothetical protein